MRLLFVLAREFLARGLYGIGVGAGLPLFLSRTSAALTAQALQGTSAEHHPERILVVLELSGGNDGLNTVVPYGDPAYYRARPTLGFPSARSSSSPMDLACIRRCRLRAALQGRSHGRSCTAAATSTRASRILVDEFLAHRRAEQRRTARVARTASLTSATIRRRTMSSSISGPRNRSPSEADVIHRSSSTIRLASAATGPTRRRKPW